MALRELGLSTEVYFSMFFDIPVSDLEKVRVVGNPIEKTAQPMGLGNTK